VDNNGQTPLTGASFFGLTNFVDLFLDSDAGVNLADTNSIGSYAGWTALHGAACGGRLEIARRLVDRGANLEAKDFWGRTPLALAKQARKTNIVDFLKTLGGHE
jgi:E3 ubiquitin-protein ligase HECTD1